MKTLNISMSDNIGQVKLSEADGEIERLNKQGRGPWRKDFSPEMFVYDESDEDIDNPMNLNDGYCWIIRG